MFTDLTTESRLVIIQAATHYIASTLPAYSPKFLSEKLDEVCEVLAKKLQEEGKVIGD